MILVIAIAIIAYISIGLATAVDSLCEDPSFNVNKVLDSYLYWFENGAYDTGATLYHTFSLMKQGFSHSQAVELSHLEYPSDGIAPAHRSTPLALFLEDTALDNAIYKESKLTHHSEISAEIAIASGRICSSLLKGIPFKEAIACSISDLNPLLFPPISTPEACSRDGYAPHVLHAALSFLRHYPSFTQALNASLLFAGAENYCPVLVGAIGGCLYGTIDLSLLAHPQTPKRFFS